MQNLIESQTDCTLCMSYEGDKTQEWHDRMTTFLSLFILFYLFIYISKYDTSDTVRCNKVFSKIADGNMTVLVFTNKRNISKELNQIKENYHTPPPQITQNS